MVYTQTLQGPLNPKAKPLAKAPKLCRDLFSLQEKLERVLTDFTDVKVFVAQAYNMTRAT